MIQQSQKTSKATVGTKKRRKRLPIAKRHPAKRSNKNNSKAAPRTAAQYFSRPERFKDTWDHVITVISKMRAEKVSLRKASREAGISPHTVVRWGGPALQKRKNGKYVAKAKDNLLRIVMIPTGKGPREIAVRGSKQASLLGEYWNAVHRYLETGDASRLAKFSGKHIKDANGVEVPLTTDRAVLNRLGSAGVLSFESLYARTA